MTTNRLQITQGLSQLLEVLPEYEPIHFTQAPINDSWGLSVTGGYFEHYVVPQTGLYKLNGHCTYSQSQCVSTYDLDLAFQRDTGGGFINIPGAMVSRSFLDALNVVETDSAAFSIIVELFKDDKIRFAYQVNYSGGEMYIYPDESGFNAIYLGVTS